MIVVIDNYDSFAQNLARYFRQCGCQTNVIRNDQTCPAEILQGEPDGIVLSPGPCTPDQAGCSLAVVRELSGKVPILGICLGHQAIVQAFGGQIIRSSHAVHGQADRMFHDRSGILAAVPNPLTVGRYHSLEAARNGFPQQTLRINGWLEDGTIMAVEHVTHPTVGLQFHPESVLTQNGYCLIEAFLRRAQLPVSTRPFSPFQLSEPATP